MFNVRLRIPVAAHQEHTETHEKSPIHAETLLTKSFPLLRHAVQMIQSKMQGIASSRWT